jgi:hypothetical protein
MEFPKYVYKRGTGRKLDDAGLFTAEARLVASPEELAALGPGWCGSPVEAAEARPEPKPEAKPEEKPKKVK